VTTKARQAVLDCEAALEDLRSGARGLLWRTRWVAAVSLLRAVGDVLYKVDGERGSELRAAIDAEHAQLKATAPEPQIFWGFIREERNNVLKAYQFSAGQSVTVRPGGISFNLTTGEEDLLFGPSGPTTYDHVMRGGPFAGQDPRDVVEHAIEWWGAYLDRVDARVEELIRQRSSHPAQGR
jgi:hypothetical protein